MRTIWPSRLTLVWSASLPAQTHKHGERKRKKKWALISFSVLDF
jgi:hypothetical protein